MKIFHDWEFLEDGQRIYPISVGMVAEDGRELYLVNAEMPASLIVDRPWLMENVMPWIPQRDDYVAGQLIGKSIDWAHPDVMPLHFIRTAVREFIAATSDPELWAWFGAFDHVCLAWLYGPMVAMPPEIPWFTNDIRTLALLAGPASMEDRPKHTGREHHALDDAKHDRELFRHFSSRMVVQRLLDRADAWPRVPAHVHLTQECEHGTRAGGCKCMTHEGGTTVEIVACPPDCTSRS